MKENQTISFDELNSAVKKSKGKSGNSQMNGYAYAIESNKNEQKIPFMLRLHEMERRNAKLKELLDKRTQELADVVAANAQSISIIAHDLRSPFCTVLFTLEMLKEDLNKQYSDEIEDTFKNASGSALSAISLIDNLAEWAMLQNKGEKFRPKKFNLKQLLSDEIENISTYENHKQISLNFPLNSDLNVFIDIQMVRTILRNLISNAIKFTDDGGEIIVSARKRNSFVEIEVADNGIGISSKNQKNIFKNENILLGTLNRDRQGSGLGLMLCKEFTEKHGGHISLESKSGKGSKFKFSLPIQI